LRGQSTIDFAQDLLARLVPASLVAIGIICDLEEGEAGVYLAPIGLTSILLALLGRSFAGSLVGILYLAFTALSTGWQGAGRLAALLGVWAVLAEVPAVGVGRILRVLALALPFWLYGSVLILVLKDTWATFYGPEGFKLAVVAGAVYFSLTTLWTLQPGRAFPNIKVISEMLRRNRILPLELLVASFVMVIAIRVEPSSLLGAIAGLPGYAWSRGLGFGREFSLLIFTIIYLGVLWLLGLVPAVNAYFLNL
jgi:hypothetical protein